MDGLQPTFDLNGGNNGFGNWGGALIGGAIGAWAGSGWGNNRYGCGNSCGSDMLMTTLDTMRTDINSISRDTLLQSSNLSGELARGQARTEAAVYTVGLQGQLASKDNTIASLGATHANEVQSLRNTFDLMSSQKDCCCTTNSNIERQGCETRALVHAEGEATRALISQLDRERLLRESAAKDAEIAQLKARQFNTDLAANNMQQVRNDMQTMMTNIIGHMAAFRTTTTPTTPTV